MKKEAEIIEDVILHLKKLGYTESNIKYEVLVDSFKRVDLVVVSGSENIIAIEVKSTLLLNDEFGELSYNPIVRQLQRSAQQLGAKIYIITNGQSYIWLKTGDIGRPVQIDPIKADSIPQYNINYINNVNVLIDHVSSYLINFPITGNHSKDLSISIYYKLLSDLNFDLTNANDEIDFFYKEDKVVLQVLDRWKDINFIESKIEVLKYIDEFLLKNKNEWQVPRWLSNLMLCFFPINENKNQLLNIFEKYGVLVSSAYLNGWKNVTSFYFNQENEYWIKSQQILSNENPDKNIYSQNLLPYGGFASEKNQFDCVLVTPPFGHSIQTYSDRNNIDSVELLIERSLDYCKPNGWSICIVPDGTLLSSKYKKFRETLIKNFSIKGIINLAPDTFKPYSSVSTSILVIQKKQTEIQKTFFSSLDEVPKTEYTSNSPVILKWNNFISNLELEDDEEGFVVHDLKVENFHFSYYWFRKHQVGIRELSSSYQAIPLKELIKKMQRGSPFQKDKEEEVPYITPASIRSMKLNEEGLSFTSIDKKPQKYSKVNQGDILVNIIGTQKGSAAVVTSDFEGLGFNHHVIRLEPNTDLVRPFYLAIALNSNYVQKQLEQGATGTVIPSLSLNSFESVYVPVPPIFIQDEICEEYQRKQEIITEKESELNNYKSELNKFLIDLGKEGIIL